MAKDESTVEDSQPSIEDDIQAAIDSLETTDEETEQEQDSSEESSENDVEDVESEPANEEDESDDTDETVAESDQDDTELLDPPQHWSAKDKELFSKQPREVQEWALERYKTTEADYTRKMQEFAPERNQYQAIKNVLEPHRADFEAAGLDTAGAVRQLAHWHNALKSGGREAVLKLAQTYRIDMSEPESDEYVDPAVKTIQSELQQLKQLQTQQMQSAQQQRVAQLSSQIQAFRNETDDTGALLHPHFDQLENEMAALMNAKLVDPTDLEGAYKKALALRPDLTPATITPISQKQASPDKAEKVRKAKKAATGVKSSGSVAKKSGANNSIEDDIMDAIRASR